MINTLNSFPLNKSFRAVGRPGAWPAFPVEECAEHLF